MKKIFLLLLFYLPILFPQENSFNVTFIVNAAVSHDTSGIYISGNLLNLGRWNPSAVRLNKNENNRWSITLNFPAGESLEYKFTRGSWETEAVNEDGTVHGNYTLTVTNDTTITYTINNWKNDPIKVFRVTGDVRYHYSIKGTNIRPRDVAVWLPEGYETDTLLSYPVLYAHDGQNVFDPATSSFGVDWQLDETADSLIKASKIEPIIIVAISNTPARTLEYTDTDTGKAYMEFIVNELKPFIDRTYKTKPGRENTATIGSSAGGLISFMLLWEHSDVFSKAACLSPAFHISDINYIPEVEKVNEKKNIKIYIDNGGVELEQRLQPGIEEMLAMLKLKGYTENIDFIWYQDKNADHSERSWASRSYKPLEFFFKNN